MPRAALSVLRRGASPDPLCSCSPKVDTFSLSDSLHLNAALPVSLIKPAMHSDTLGTDPAGQPNPRRKVAAQDLVVFDRESLSRDRPRLCRLSPCQSIVRVAALDNLRKESESQPRGHFPSLSFRYRKARTPPPLHAPLSKVLGVRHRNLGIKRVKPVCPLACTVLPTSAGVPLRIEEKERAGPSSLFVLACVVPGGSSRSESYREKLSPRCTLFSEHEVVRKEVS